MRSLVSLWKFSRPHTVVGSVIGILTLFYIVCEKQESLSISYLLLALGVGVSSNIFIVGINQIADVEIDRVNKPFLPIPSGIMSLLRAKMVVAAALSISLTLSLWTSPYLFAIIGLASVIGWAYSMPPCHLKKHFLGATLSIVIVRGVLLNLGGYLVFNHLVNNSVDLPNDVLILTIFIVLFSMVISWFKDLPDISGDSQFNIKTLAIEYTPKLVLILGSFLVGLAYMFTILLKWIEVERLDFLSFRNGVLLFGHITLVALFITILFFVDLADQRSVKNFYKRFWWFLFAEYALYLFAYVGPI